MKDKLNVADWLSVSRIILIPFLLVFIAMEKNSVVGWLVLLGFLTDALDGFLARKLNKTSKRGTKLDSIGDMLLIASALLGLFWLYTDFVVEHAWPALTAIGLFLLQFILSRIRYGKSSSFHTYMAKITAVALALMLVSSFFFGIVPWLYYLAFIAAIVEAVEEIMLVFVLEKQRENVKGLYWVLKEGKE
ncbi:hypothetical protein PKOR_22620 [Pontibacter korlensis]|uniref:CDP-alcohol phosphatidyltransferase n=1 Tax=Pontibacter korlensis TaxID=400092 RepID=A0A0E3UZH2_9BACT|nr:CDP-alcohol phosphatidyltransferase family protein [Pontibacter korlensis]AKD05336.1 hypothetical protein PKOR_22620 [Pontibacter korlensis]